MYGVRGDLILIMQFWLKQSQAKANANELISYFSTFKGKPVYFGFSVIASLYIVAKCSFSSLQLFWKCTEHLFKFYLEYHFILSSFAPMQSYLKHQFWMSFDKWQLVQNASIEFISNNFTYVYLSHFICSFWLIIGQSEAAVRYYTNYVQTKIFHYYFHHSRYCKLKENLCYIFDLIGKQWQISCEQAIICRLKIVITN